ncbi:hypothetical protein HPP92_020477 [Vanilla planifolia]|uniref:Uncharacterized protein n=1 Tax=Vanilla planifolia TaxID=51239 RepID=A0A835UK52_VANPL|nr:hypothetical protein HPP92_020477 [Vanilla planifolia]
MESAASLTLASQKRCTDECLSRTFNPLSNQVLKEYYTLVQKSNATQRLSYSTDDQSSLEAFTAAVKHEGMFFPFSCHSLEVLWQFKTIFGYIYSARLSLIVKRGDLGFWLYNPHFMKKHQLLLLWMERGTDVVQNCARVKLQQVCMA